MSILEKPRCWNKPLSQRMYGVSEHLGNLDEEDEYFYRISEREVEVLIDFKNGKDYTDWVISTSRGFLSKEDKPRIKFSDCLAVGNVCFYIDGKWSGYVEPWLELN